jgi:uncharacterized membrane protein YphA (DoxX/SURF4 family)
VADREDFRIQAKNFDLTNGLNIPRIISGLFFFPHVMGKFAAGTVSAATAGFFAKAGFHPPEVWVYVAAVSETAVAVALVLGICTRFAALGAVALLAIAVTSLQVVKGFGWTWTNTRCSGRSFRFPSPSRPGRAISYEFHRRLYPTTLLRGSALRSSTSRSNGLQQKAGRDWHHHSRALRRRPMGQGG